MRSFKTGKEKMENTYAVVNQKGGVGKTTTAVNLCAELGRSGRRVLLCDLDPQANATSGVGHSRDDREHNIYRVLTGNLGMSEAVCSTEFAGLDLVPSHPDLTGAEVELVAVLGREFILRDALAPVVAAYDYVVIDCPPSLNILVINALAAARKVIVPIQCEYYALEGLSLLMNTISLVRDRLNPELSLAGVLMTMADGRTNLSGQVIEEVRSHFGERVFTSVIPRNIRLGEAPSFGRPIGDYAPASKGAAAYRNFARELTTRGRGPLSGLNREMPAGREED